MKSNPNPASRPVAPVVSRLRRTFSVLSLPLLAAGLLPSSTTAQTVTSAVPNLISYQGKVSNSSGTLVGAGTPVNRLVIFRIWSHQSNSTVGDLVFSEQQTVTISEGEFSVLIGQGAAVSGTPLGYSEATKNSFTALTVFGGATRYLGVTIDDGTGAADPEVSPRQQLVTSAFAMRAKYAESIGSNGNSTLTVTDSGNLGINYATPTVPLNFAATLGDKIHLYANMNYGLGIQANNLQLKANWSTDDITFGYGPSASMTELLRIKCSNGNVGIGTNNPGTKLDVIGSTRTGGVANPAFVLTDNVNAQVGLMAAATNPGAFTTDAAAKDMVVRADGGGKLHLLTGSGAAAITVNTSNNVGIGNPSPTAKLHVNGSINSTSLTTGSLSLAGPMQVSGAATTHTQGAHIEWDRGLNLGMTFLLNQKGLGVGGMVFGEVSSADAVTERMRIDSNGNLGIGKSTPTEKLHVGGSIKVDGGIKVGAANVIELGAGVTKQIDAGKIGYAVFSQASTGTDGALDIVGVANGTNARKVRLWDYVGIGTSNPTQAPLVVFGTAAGETFGQHASFVSNSDDLGNANGTFTFADISIKAQHGIHANFYRAISDERIKRIQGRSHGPADLALLSKIEITDYTYRDTATKGVRPQKKVIGQQIEAVFPQAVAHSTDVVPDIYKKAAVENGWVKLATDLKVGERVRLVGPKTDSVFEVLEVQPRGFRTGMTEKLDDLFVYGREVKDFRVVDYEAISMLNVSATQELARQVDALKASEARNAELAKRVAELEAKDRSRDAKLASIEKLLQANQTVMARPAATPRTNNNGQE